MRKCRSIRPLLAAALYESLNSAERDAVDHHLAGCARCRTEHLALERTVNAIPKKAQLLDTDLAPRIMARLENRSRRTWRLAWAMPVAAAACAVVLAVAFLYQSTAVIPANPLTSNPPLAASQGLIPVASSADASTVTPVELALDESEALIARHAHADALLVLQDALRLHPHDPAAGMAQLQVAELEFQQLKRYPQAFDAYVRLRNQFPDIFAGDRRNIERFDLLVESWQDSFKDLYALDIARNSGEGAFTFFEDILAQNPGKLVALVALNEMLRRHAGHDNGDIAALERLRNQCKNPVAVAQVCLALGDAFARHSENRQRARGFYEAVLNSGNETLAAQARAALARLESR